MKITQICAAGLKGSKPFKHELAGVTVFTGANAQGKTTRLETMQLAMAGYVPGISSKPGDIHEKLASSQHLSCGIATDNGGIISRVWTKDNKGSVKLAQVFTGFPDGFAVAPVLLDPTVFLGLSAKERTKFLFRTLPPPPLDKVGPAVLVANLKNIKLEENTEATEAVINDLCKWVADDWVAKDPTVTVQEWLDALVEKVRVKANAAAATAKRMETTNAGLTQLKVDGASFAAAEQAKAAATHVLDEAKRVLNECRGNYTRAKAELDAARVLAAAAVDVTEVRRRIELLQQCIMLEKIAVNPGNAPTHVTMPDPRPSTSAAHLKLRQAAAMAHEAHLNQKDAIREVKRIESEIDSATHKTSCPACGQGIAHLQEAVIKTLRAQLNAAQAKDVSLTSVAAVAEGNSIKAKEELDEVEKSIKIWDEMKHLLDKQNDDLMKNYNAKLAEYNNSQTAINTATAAIQRHEASIAANAAAAAAKESVPALEAKVIELFEAGNRAKVAETNAGVDFMTADQKHRQAIADKATAQSQARALAEAAKARCEVEIVKQFAQFLNELMALIIEQSVQPLLATCNRICDGILRYPLVLVDGEIGMRNPAAASGFVSWKTFSGAERALTLAGLSVALSVGQPFKLVMIDEFGKLSAENKTKMFARLLKLVEEKFIDQAIIVDPDTNFYRNIGDVKDFTCIEIVRD